jgi:hypothetical protein
MGYHAFPDRPVSSNCQIIQALSIIETLMTLPKNWVYVLRMHLFSRFTLFYLHHPRIPFCNTKVLLSQQGGDGEWRLGISMPRVHGVASITRAVQIRGVDVIKAGVLEEIANCLGLLGKSVWPSSG